MLSHNNAGTNIEKIANDKLHQLIIIAYCHELFAFGFSIGVPCESLGLIECP